MSYIICQNNPIIFIHIPKTAGASVINSFNENKIIIKNIRTRNNNYHSTLNDYTASYNTDAWKFTVVRNPYQRAVSWYMFRKRILQLSLKRYQSSLPIKKVENNFEKIKKEYDYMLLDFNLWLEKYVNQNWDFTWFSLSHDQTTWIEPLTSIDKVFKFETLNKDFQEIFNLTLPHKNKSTSKSFNWRELYNRKGKDLITDVYKRDLENFDYTFN